MQVKEDQITLVQVICESASGLLCASTEAALQGGDHGYVYPICWKR